MAWARRVGATLSGSANTGASTNFGNLGATPSANDRIIAVVGFTTTVPVGFASVTGIADSAGNTYTRDLQTQKNFTTYLASMEVWSAVAAGAAANNFTVSYSLNLTAVGGVAIAVGAYSGLDTTTGAAAAVDISKASDGTGTSSPADSGTTAGTTAAASELKIGAYNDQGYNVVISAGTLDTTYSKVIQTQSTTEDAMLEDADSGASGSTARATATWASGTQDWQMAVLVYKLAGGAGAASKNLSTLTLTGAQ